MKPRRGKPLAKGAALPATLPHGHVLLGVFGAARGIKGEIRLKSFTEDPLAIASSYRPLRAADGRELDLLSVRLQKDMLIARVKGIEDRASAERLVNLELYGPRAAFGAPDEDEFFHVDLIGLKAETQNGQPFGIVTGLFNFGAGDLIEILPSAGGRVMLLPFTKAVVPVVNVRQGRIVIAPPIELESDDEKTNRAN